MDYPKFIVSKQKEESVSIQMVNKEGNDKKQIAVNLQFSFVQDNILLN